MLTSGGTRDLEIFAVLELQDESGVSVSCRRPQHGGHDMIIIYERHSSGFQTCSRPADAYDGGFTHSNPSNCAWIVPGTVDPAQD